MSNEISTEIIKLLFKADITLSDPDLELTEYQWEQIRGEWADIGLTLAKLKVLMQHNTKTQGDKYKDLESIHIDNFTEAMKVLN